MPIVSGVSWILRADAILIEDSRHCLKDDAWVEVSRLVRLFDADFTRLLAMSWRVIIGEEVWQLEVVMRESMRPSPLLYTLSVSNAHSKSYTR